MSYNIIHRNSDGSVVGVDGEGHLFRGSPRPYSGPEVERVVTSRSPGSVAFEDRVDGVVVGGGEVEEAAFHESHGEGPPDHQWLTYTWQELDD